ncbi:MAG: type I-B CRISPR-associated protein Cas8b1/Cst1 [Johnsonella sp.]|nr:type I-B CRISPR-associated protein Cas8b1/Cst1 [Johnsonella sp.]
MGEKIRLHLKDWQFNMGLLGLYNILHFSKEHIEYEEDYIEFEQSALENFEEKYFSFLIERYGEMTHWKRLEEMALWLDDCAQDDYVDFGKKELEKVSKFISDLKQHLKKENYKKVYPFIESETDIQALEKRLKTIKIVKNQAGEEGLEELRKQHELIREIYEFVFSASGKRYLFAKNIIYNIINNSWSDISFLNAQTKEFDVYQDFKKEFTDKTLKYLREDKSKYKLNCFVTGLPIKGASYAYELSFLNDTGFDINRKPSNIWAYHNDIFICDLARLVYICMPCGLIYSGFKEAIFVNANQNMHNLIRTNAEMYEEIDKSASEIREKAGFFTYKALIQSIQKQEMPRGTRYELSDVQLVRMSASNKGEMRYKFNILSKDILKVLYDARTNINAIIAAGYSEGKMYTYLYPTVIDHLMNRTNLFNLIHTLLIRKLDESQKDKNYYRVSHIEKINKINLKFMEGVSSTSMEYEVIEKMVDSAKNSGYYLAEAYKAKNAENKINGIAYRLLNALKTRNSELFMHTLLSCYMYIGKPVPKDIEKVLCDDELLGEMGYAFVTGLAGSILKENKEKSE